MTFCKRLGWTEFTREKVMFVLDQNYIFFCLYRLAKQQQKHIHLFFVLINVWNILLSLYWFYLLPETAYHLLCKSFLKTYYEPIFHARVHYIFRSLSLKFEYRNFSQNLFMHETKTVKNLSDITPTLINVFSLINYLHGTFFFLFIFKKSYL